VQSAGLRELREETGVEAVMGGLIDVVDGIFPDADRHFVLIDYWAEWLSGAVMAGDDATHAAFFSKDETLRLVSWSATRRIIEQAYDLRDRKQPLSI